MATATERNQTRHREEADEAVLPLLARANLYRLRGQWNEAIAVCTEALRVAPQSPTAHSLLGDIYEAQGKIDDAVQWFGMAVDLDDTNAADRVKLERVLSIKRAQMEASATVPQAAPTLPASKEKTLDRTIEWFDRSFPPGRSDSIVRLILFVAVGIAGIIACSAAFVYFTIRRENPPTTSTNTVTSYTPPGGMPVNPAVVVVPTPLPRIAATPSNRVERGNTTAASPIPTITPSALPTTDPRVLADTIARTLGNTVSVQGIQATGGVIQVSLQMETQVVDEPADRTRERVLRAAAAAAHAAAIVEPTAQKTILTVTLVSGITAFRGEATIASVRQYNAPLVPSSDLPKLFTSIQWGVSLTTQDNVPPTSPTPDTSATTTR
jgi:hypothetical protein